MPIDGTPYEQDYDVCSIDVKYSFNPSIRVHNEHQCNGVPWDVIEAFGGLILNPFGSTLSDEHLFPDPSTVAVIPITWE